MKQLIREALQEKLMAGLMRYFGQHLKGHFEVDDDESFACHVEGEVVEINFKGDALEVSYRIDGTHCRVQNQRTSDGVYEILSLAEYLENSAAFNYSSSTVLSILEINAKHYLYDKIEAILEYFGIDYMPISCVRLSDSLNEAVIAPFDFAPALEKIRKKKIKSVDQLEAVFDGKVKFVSLEQFLQMDPSAKVPKMMNVHYGVLLGTVMNGTVYVVGNLPSMIRHLNSWWDGKDALRALLNTIRHESVHVQQIKKANGKNSDVSGMETANEYRNYMSNKMELMAYARTIIDELSPKYSHQQLLQALRSGKLPNSIFQGYVQMFHGDEEVLNRLRKYLYQYLTLG